MREEGAGVKYPACCILPEPSDVLCIQTTRPLRMASVHVGERGIIQAKPVMRQGPKSLLLYLLDLLRPLIIAWGLMRLVPVCRVLAMFLDSTT